MSLGLAVLIVVFIALIALDTPIAFVIGIATVLSALALGQGDVFAWAAQEMGSGLDKFALLAIPFFILAGDLMGSGGLARRLIDFAAAFLGRFPGGLALVNTLTCMLFGAISGSAAAAVSSIGGTLIPEMNRKGYGRDFNIALTATAATTGLLIPPSNVMIVYAVVASGISIGALFMAGVMPGILVGSLIMLVCVIVSMVKGYGRKGEGKDGAMGVVEPEYPFLVVCWRAFPSLLLVVFVLGGILSGKFTATEASAVAVLWAFLLAVVFYREVPLKNLPKIMIGSARTTGIVMLLVAASVAMSRLLTAEQVPQMVSAALLEGSAPIASATGIPEKIVILLMINLILLLVGTFMDMTPAVLVFTPIFLPVALSDAVGLHPVHFGIMLIANLCIGICTPPVGTCLFLGCSVGKSKIARVSVAMLPFYLAMFIGLMLITYWPDLSLWLPRILDQLN